MRLGKTAYSREETAKARQSLCEQSTVPQELGAPRWARKSWAQQVWSTELQSPRQRGLSIATSLASHLEPHHKRCFLSFFKILCSHGALAFLGRQAICEGENPSESLIAETKLRGDGPSESSHLERETDTVLR